ncbi:MAG: helix-turn-helix transcriptional regulator [Bacteroidia bacterium]|nr:helix-turn-helix transcriptional regulator [Bacteroidia bacterium]
MFQSRGPVSEKQCLKSVMAVKDALFVIGGKWKILILIALSHGNKRFTDIQKAVPKISGKVLAKELKEMEENQLVKRTVFEDYPVRIEYTLTEYAGTLEKVIFELGDWGANHRKRIMDKE